MEALAGNVRQARLMKNTRPPFGEPSGSRSPPLTGRQSPPLRGQNTPPAPYGAAPLAGGPNNALLLFASPERGGGSRQRTGGVGPQVRTPKTTPQSRPFGARQLPFQGGLINWGPKERAFFSPPLKGEVVRASEPEGLSFAPKQPPEPCIFYGYLVSFTITIVCGVFVFFS